MDPILELLELARDGFAQRMTAVAPSAWERPTPCSDWNVRLLVNHVVGGEIRMRRLVEGGTLAEFVATRDDDVLGSDPAGAWDRAVSAFDRVLAEPGALGRSVEYRTGPIPARQLLAVRVFDVAVHTWDLACAIGADETLHPDLVAAALETWAALAGSALVTNAALFAPPGSPVADDGTPQQRLLAACGR